GTYPLPEAQLDRLLVRIGIGSLGREEEWQMLKRRVDRLADEVELERVVDAPTLRSMQDAIERVHVSEAIGYSLLDPVAATRASPKAQVGSSPRGTLALMKLARSRAALAGR